LSLYKLEVEKWKKKTKQNKTKNNSITFLLLVWAVLLLLFFVSPLFLASSFKLVFWALVVANSNSFVL